MNIKKIFQCLSFIIFCVFFAHYYQKSSNPVIEVKGDLPKGYLKDQWDEEIRALILDHPSKAQKALESWMLDNKIYGSVFLERQSAGRIIVDLVLKPFNLLINDQKCISYDGLVSSYPCFFHEDKVGFIQAPQHLARDIIIKKKYLESISIIPGKFFMQFSSFGYIDLKSDNKYSCRLSLSYELIPQISTCLAEQDVDHTIGNLDFTLDSNILALK